MNRDSPWNRPRFIFEPGRFYDRMVFIHLLPEIITPFGGDHQGLIWRFDSDPPEGDWVYTYRNRYSAGPNSDPFDGGDKKIWTVARGPLPQLREIVASIAVMAGKVWETTKPDENLIIIDGDHEKFIRIIDEGNFPWMHSKAVPNPHES